MRTIVATGVLWSLVGGSAAFLLVLAADWPLLLAGLLYVPAFWQRGAASGALAS